MTEAEWTMEVKSRRLKRALTPPALLALKALSRLESRIWAGVRLRFSPVFIVAPPRAGTTVLYQVMTGHLSTSYFTNLAMRLHIQDAVVLPIFGALLTRWLRPNQNAAFDSYYGATKGLDGPHEGHWVWNQYFPEEPHYIPDGYLGERARQGLYRAVAGTERVFDRPFVGKHIRNSVRIRAFAEVFPTALFIQCVRDPLDVAQSIWTARTRDFPFTERQVPDPARWWFSVKPREYEAIRHKSLVEQVCEQVYYVEQNIAQDREAVGADRFLIISYRDLCLAPQQEIERVVEFMNAHAAPTRILRPIPASFPYSTGRKIDPADYEALADYIGQLYPNPDWGLTGV